ncbi:MAG TPA: T9SS type A sorting domain-containing protein [Bacteroidetes bacterium]|nr:T9SS type A sorting domain-containing protein [Bacteroidota bacterium]
MLNKRLIYFHRKLLLGLVGLFMYLPGQAQIETQGAGKQFIRFSESTAIQSNDAGKTWHLQEGKLENVPKWAQAWLGSETAPATRTWEPRNNGLKFRNGSALKHNANTGEWSLTGKVEMLPEWARRWLPNAPRKLAEGHQVTSLCGSTKPIQRTQNLQLAAGLAIRSYDGGATWVMSEGKREELPAWVAPWLEKTAKEVQPALERAFDHALIRSVDGGKTWKQVEGKLEDLPAWIRPWLGGEYAGTQASGPATRTVRQGEGNISLFPNPAQHSVTLRFNLKHSQQVQVELYDLQGKLIRQLMAKKMPLGDNEVEFALSNLPAGTYFLRFESEMGQEHMRLVKAN